MNKDDFEQQLRNQPLRPVPPGWRREILQAALAESARPANGASWADAWARLRQWLWPAPQAWAGLAAVWTVVLILHFSGSATSSQASAARRAPTPPSEMAIVLQEQRRLRAELLDESAEADAHAPSPRPRSQTADTNLNA